MTRNYEFFRGEFMQHNLCKKKKRTSSDDDGESELISLFDKGIKAVNTTAFRQPTTVIETKSIPNPNSKTGPRVLRGVCDYITCNLNYFQRQTVFQVMINSPRHHADPIIFSYTAINNDWI